VVITGGELPGLPLLAILVRGLTIRNVYIVNVKKERRDRVMRRGDTPIVVDISFRIVMILFIVYYFIAAMR